MSRFILDAVDATFSTTTFEQIGGNEEAILVRHLLINLGSQSLLGMVNHP